MIDKSIGIIIAIVGVASLAVVVSKKSDTAKVVGAVTGGLSKLNPSITATLPHFLTPSRPQNL
jgi:hypothetical protein